ncbi:MAG: cysteine--tRNA ligase [Bdellovibrionales bacterium]|nr:cysteine--tRNA ligase [Bdellovibrionales bacterium]
MSLQIYNSMTRKKEPFVPVREGEVRMYVCGPTVYNYLHVGNFFGAIFFNVVRNWLEHSGYKVTYVYNYTDIEDRIFERSIKEQKPFQEITEHFIKEFETDFRNLKLTPHSHNPRVTDYVDDIIQFISDLVDKGKAYAVDGDVYFDVHSFPDYGKLSNKNIEDLEAGYRIEADGRKKHPSDFALWKSAKPGEAEWESPWGKGRPGWHIECSCMSRSLLGDTIDIHGGGLDLIFPHHENEIAQSEALSGKKYVNYWMHNNMLNFGDQKMSKSLGNVTTGRDFMTQYNGEILKYMILSSHYRSTIDFSETQVERAIASLAKFYSALALASKIKESSVDLGAVPKDFADLLEKSAEGVATALNDDFNTAEVMARFFEVVRSFNQHCRKPGKMKPEQKAVAQSFLEFFSKYGQGLLALFGEEPQSFLIKLDDKILEKKDLSRAQIDQLVQDRIEARNNKDYKRGDEIRDELTSMGILVQDSHDGTMWEVDK